jgi:hypothetical protein
LTKYNRKKRWQETTSCGQIASGLKEFAMTVCREAAKKETTSCGGERLEKSQGG